MPTLEELITQSVEGRLSLEPQQAREPEMPKYTPEQLQELIFKKPVGGGLLKATGDAISSPGKALKGASWDFLKDAAKGIGSTLLNIPNAFLMGAKMPGSTDPALPVASKWSEVIPNVNQRFGALSNAVMLGLPDLLARNISEQYPAGAKNPISGQGGTDLSFEEKALAVGKGVVKTAVADVLPGRVSLNFLRGQDIEGNPLTPETYGETLAILAASWLPFAGMFGRRGAAAARLTKVPKITEKIRTAGEIEAARASLTEQKSLLGQKGWITRREGEAAQDLAAGKAPVEVRPKVDLPELEQHFKLLEEGAMDDPTTRVVMDEVIGSEIGKRLAPKLKSQGLEANKIIGDLIRRGGAVSDTTLQALRTQFGIPEAAVAGEVTQALANVIERTASVHGKGLQAFSATLKQQLDEAYLAARNTTDPQALLQLRKMQKLVKKMEKDPNANLLRRAETLSRGMSGGMETLRAVEKVWISSMLAQPATAARNLYAQGMILGSQILGHVASGTVEAVTGLAKGDGLGFAKYYGDLWNDFAALSSAFPSNRIRGKTLTKRRTLLNSIIDNTPELSMIDTGAAYTTQYNTIKDLFKTYGRSRNAGSTRRQALGAVKSFADEAGWLDIYTDGLTMMNRLQETTLRKVFFDGQLRSNLDSIGFKGGYKELLDQIKTQEKLPENLRAAMADAYEHSMKQTLAHTPEGNVGKAFVKAIDSVPFFGKALITPFPRFMVNQFRFILERNPMQWAELFSPEIREALSDGVANGFAKRKASRALGQATEGVALLAGAWIHRQSVGEKYKYYEHPTNEKDEKGHEVVEDWRNYQPFVSYLAAAELIDAAQKGKSFEDMPYSTNEWFDMMLGIRRLTEVGLFAGTDIARAATSGDARQLHRAMGTPIGQLAASFFVPLRALKDMMAVVNPENAEQADVEYEELTGPTRSNIPEELLPAGAELPGRIDYTTGEEVKTYLPWARQITGITKRGISPIQRLILSTPGLSERELVGEHGSREANQLVARTMGTLLSTSLDKDKTFGDFLADTFTEMELSPQMQKLLVQGFFTTLREKSKDVAKKLRPELFLKEEQVGAAPAPMKEMVEEMADTLLGILRTQGVSPQPTQ